MVAALSATIWPFQTAFIRISSWSTAPVVELGEDRLPAKLPELLDVALRDRIEPAGIVLHPRDALLPEQVQHRVRRAIGKVLDVVRHRLAKLIVRMEARDLDGAVQIQIGHELF